MMSEAHDISEQSLDNTHPHGVLTQPRVQLWMSIVAGVLLVVGVLGRLLLGNSPLFAGCDWLSLSVGLFYGVFAAIEALRDRRIDIDILMVVAAVLAASVGHPEEGALLLVLFSFASALEELAMDRTTREIKALQGIIPDRAIVLREDVWIEVAPDGLAVGEQIRIRPGDRVPVDGVILDGSSSMDESTLTGESVLRDVGAGDEIYAGTINTSGVLRVRVLKPAADSSVQRVLALVTQARQQREPLQQMIDRIGEPYSIGVMLVSVLIFFIWWQLLGMPMDDAAMTAITLLIVASPCALVLATPTATLSAIARGARAGVLFKGGESINRLSHTKTICFDKTGTLTQGKPIFREVLVHHHAAVDTPVATATLLEIAQQLEADSTHPVASAICKEARDQLAILRAAQASAMQRDQSVHTARPTKTLDARSRIVEEIHTVPGRGIQGVWCSQQVRIGSLLFVREIVDTEAARWLAETLDGVRQRGQLGIALGVSHCQGKDGCPGCNPDGAVLGEDGARSEATDTGHAKAQSKHNSCVAVLVLEDALREGAARVVKALHQLDIRPVQMLTGDNPVIAARVAHEVGLDGFDASLLPEDKIAAVEKMKALLGSKATNTCHRHGVAVIGDGVNDAPALAAADVSIAIGSIGADAALESADIVLLSDDLARVPRAVALARATRRTIGVNITVALGVIIIMGVMVLTGSLIGRPVPLALGVVAHEGGTVVVVLNSIRLLWFSMTLARQ